MTAAPAPASVESVVRGDAALLEDDLSLFLRSAAGDPPAADGTESVFEAALRRALRDPVADAMGSKVGQEALRPRPGAPGHHGPPLRPSMVYWAYRNYRGFDGDPGYDAADLDAVRRVAVAVRVLLKAAVVLDDIQDGSVVRYGEDALHVPHGIPTALNTGCWLIMSALRHAAAPAVVANLVRSVGGGFAGQAADLSTRTPATRAALISAPLADRVTFWESVAELKTATLFHMPLDAAAAALRVSDDDRRELDDAMRSLGLASQLFNDLTDFVPELGGANTYEDYDGLTNRVFLELLDSAPRSLRDSGALVGADLKSFVLGHPRLPETLVRLAAEAVELKSAAKASVHRVCRSEASAAYFDLTIERKGHLIDRLYLTVRSWDAA